MSEIKVLEVTIGPCVISSSESTAIVTSSDYSYQPPRRYDDGNFIWILLGIWAGLTIAVTAIIIGVCKALA